MLSRLSITGYRDGNCVQSVSEESGAFCEKTIDIINKILGIRNLRKQKVSFISCIVIDISKCLRAIDTSQYRYIRYFDINIIPTELKQ